MYVLSRNPKSVYAANKANKEKISSYMCLAKPAKLQSEEGQVRPMCDDRTVNQSNVLICGQ